MFERIVEWMIWCAAPMYAALALWIAYEVWR